MKAAAIIGCGGIAHTHTEALGKLENVHLVALCDILPDRASALGKEFNIKAEIFTDYKQMLEQVKLDVVHITTPHYLHFEMAAFALKKGINVVLEKPVCINEAQLEELTKIAEQSSAKICICFQNRFLETNKMAKSLITSGEAGAVKGARAFVTWSRNAPYYIESGWRGSKITEGGGVMINQAIHTLDLMLWLCGKANTITATTGNRHLQGVIDVEDTAEAYIEFENGAKGLFYATTAYCTDAPIFLEIVCEKMALTFFNDTLLINGKECTYAHSNTSLASSKSYWGNGHLDLLQDYYKKLDTQEPVAINVPEAGKALRALLAIYKSNGKPIQL